MYCIPQCIQLDILYYLFHMLTMCFSVGYTFMSDTCVMTIELTDPGDFRAICKSALSGTDFWFICRFRFWAIGYLIVCSHVSEIL